MERMKRKSLNSKWFFPNQEYFKELDKYVDKLEEHIDKLEEELAKSGNKYYQRDAAEMSKKWLELNIRFGEVERAKITLESKLNAEIERKEKEIQYLQEQLEYYEAEEKPVTSKKRDKFSGRFVSDIPKKEKVTQCYLLHKKGYNNSQIGRRLNLSPDTVRKYLAEYINTWQYQEPVAQDEQPAWIV